MLTLTRGGATKQRFKYNLGIAEMGEVRVKEMEAVKKVLGLTSMEILDLEDGGLAEMNPIGLEKIVHDRIEKIKPDIVVTYAVHGISGHHDHLVIHAVIKRLFCDPRTHEPHRYWKRLAFFTLPAPANSERDGGMAHVRTSPLSRVDCVVQLSEEERVKLRAALYCYETFIDVIESTDVINVIGDRVHFEFYGEDFKPPLSDPGQQLKP